MRRERRLEKREDSEEGQNSAWNSSDLVAVRDFEGS